MPVHDYGVWKANAVHYVVESREDGSKNPHLLLYFDDKGNTTHHARYHARHRSHKPSQRNKEIVGLIRAVVNIKSGDKPESQVVCWVDRDFKDQSIIDGLKDLPLGFHQLAETSPGPAGLRTDYLRTEPFGLSTGRILPLANADEKNDIAGILEPEIEEAINQSANIYLFGARFVDYKGIHNLHMNQGNIGLWEHDDGVFQDGFILFHRPREDRWVAVFIGFTSQAVETDESSGHPLSSSDTWNES
ncbi:hypothetical protein N7466_003138 [Penicillium verhagenii]|uniref:uncharacterized protein n=1 Tax=Penicillium verhagenii TaxID=1562060 RepID=UPI0025459B88|nr:uncharacterized protein N7466_003138 [Penicillium verhagenii]KAJ5936688.1 hypothetical protein N7466_003138 [Penicillium verhagenii]